MITYKKKFISLDLETTHLDMEEGRIMELGAVEVELEWDAKAKKIKANLGKSFSSLVNPEVPVSRIALALTGISEQELKTASAWKDVKQKFLEFVGTGAVVGHNIDFDLEFLKNQGLNLKNEKIDTLEMVQTLFPTWDSHSLEFAASELNVLPVQSHRALADSETVGRFLAACLNDFMLLPADLKKTVQDMAGQSTLGFRDLIADLPTIALNHSRAPEARKKTATGSKVLPESLEDRMIYHLPLPFDEERNLFFELAGRQESLVVALPSNVYYELSGPFDLYLPAPGYALCPVRFAEVLEGEMTDLLVKMSIKVSIFKFEQPGSLDLSKIKWTRPERSLLGLFNCKPSVCLRHECEYARFLNLESKATRFVGLPALFDLAAAWKRKFLDCRLVMFNLASVEDEFTESATETWSLQKIREKFLKSFSFGRFDLKRQPQLPKEVEAISNELDMFFGIFHFAFLKRENEFAQNLVVDDPQFPQEGVEKLFHPAEKLAVKLEIFQKYLDSRIPLERESVAAELSSLRDSVSAFKEFLTEFFGARDGGNLYWIKFDANYVEMSRVPREIGQKFLAFLNNFQSASIIDKQIPQISYAYFQNRLGLKDFKTKTTGKPEAGGRVKITIYKNTLAEDAFHDFISALPGDTLAVLPNETKLAESYEKMFRANDAGKDVLAYKFSGGLGALRKKLSVTAKKKSRVLLLTNHAFLKYFSAVPAMENLVLVRLPFDPSGGKASLMGLERQSSFMGHVLPRAIHSLYTMLGRFLKANATGQRIFILDSRVLTDYDQAFLRFLEEYPDFEIEIQKNPNQAG
ncbi:hypothetical protein D4R52_00220 [bacterium]|nr:MAG: hypothetical protein D4R52_00220 [bacterium]